MAIKDGFRTHTEGSIKRYRVPDLLTQEEFQIYMAGTYGIAVDFRPLTDEEKKRLDSGEPLVFTPYGPTDRDREFAMLREKLGITALEEHVGMNRQLDPDSRDPIVELDSRVMSTEEFADKYGEQPRPSAPVETDEVKEAPPPGTETGERSVENDPQAPLTNEDVDRTDGDEEDPLDSLK